VASERYEEELELWSERLKLVDALIEKPVKTLIDVTTAANARFGSLKAGQEMKLADYAVPTLLRDRESAVPAYSYLVHVTTGSLLQRVHRKARRLRSIDADTRRKLDVAVAALITPLVSNLQELAPQNLIDDTADDVFGKPNPLTAAETFWLLVNSGERNAHARLGFFSLFVLLWALRRRSDADGPTGVAIADWRPSALLTARCLLPLERLTYILRNRADLYARILDKLQKVQENAAGEDQHSRWQLASNLEQLSSALHDFAEVATNPGEFAAAAKQISQLAAPMTPMTLLADRRNAAAEATFRVADVLVASGRLNLELLRESRQLLEELDAGHALFGGDAAAETAAKKVCANSLRRLRLGAAKCARVRAAKTASEGPDLSANLKETIDSVVAINREIATEIDEHVRPNIRWLRRVVTQEIAYASAGNETDFDAAELLSALVIVERWMRISDLEVEDAIRRSLTAARSDGSWSTGQPLFLKDRVLGVWPNTPEVVWLLTTAIERKKKIRHADDALFSFVQWLDKTKIDLVVNGQKFSGWPSEARESDSIDIWSTALSLNALLGIRDIIEHRLWELCERRFYVTSNVKSLWNIDPVDVGAQHAFRLHRRLMNMARDTKGANYSSAEYALILHGPPGSSKTAIAEALASEMWKGRHREPRLIRITPADFTRQGESRVDSEARFIFDLISRLRGVTIFFDEIDDLLQKRRKSGQISFLNLIVPAMLNRLQDLRDAAPRQEICFLMATNYIDSIEPALTRPGRIDSSIPVPYPDPWSRRQILEAKLTAKKVSLRRQDWKDEIIAETSAWPWATFNKLCNEIARQPPIRRSEFETAIKQLRDQFEDAAAYYHAPARWHEVGRPFVNEYVHAIFARSEDPERCLSAIDGLHAALARDKTLEAADLVPIESTVRKAFWKAWQREERPAPAKGAELPIDFGSPADARPGAKVLPARTTFRVWAPNASSVHVTGSFNHWSTTANPLIAEGDGMWAGAVEPSIAELSTYAEAGQPHGMYKFVIRNRDRREELWREDPYAAETFTTPFAPRNEAIRNAVATKDLEWSGKAYMPARDDLVLYQLHPASFGGPVRQFDAIRAKLDHLRDLGVNMLDVVVFGPGAASAPAELRAREDERTAFDHSWGYDTAFPFAVAGSAGGAEAFHRLVQEANARNIGVMLGLVCHRLGREGRDLWKFDGGRTEEHKDDGGIYYRGPRQSEEPPIDRLVPDFDLPEVRNFFVDNATRWMEERHVSGFHWTRPQLLVATSTDSREYSGVHILRAINTLVHAQELVSIAEDADDSPNERAAELLDAGCDLQWSQRFMQVLHANINVREDEQRDIGSLASVLASEPGLGTRRVLYSESYEEARKGRVPRMHPEDPWPHALQLALLGAAMVLTAPGVPMLFEGQEFGDRSGFELVDSVVRPVDWEAAEKNAHLVEWYRQLIALRRNLGGVTGGLRGDGAEILSADNTAKRIAFQRWDANAEASSTGNPVIVAANFSGAPCDFTFPAPSAGPWHFRFDTAGRMPSAIVATTTLTVPLEGYGIAILSQGEAVTPPAKEP
jgi:1,4-alpha-glucan branching enzyme